MTLVIEKSNWLIETFIKGNKVILLAHDHQDACMHACILMSYSCGIPTLQGLIHHRVQNGIGASNRFKFGTYIEGSCPLFICSFR